MRRATIPIMVSLLAALLLALPAQARLKWCRSDPVITLDGTPVDIAVAIPPEHLPAAAAADGPIRYGVRTPRGIEGRLVLSDPGYNLQGSRVAFASGDGRATGRWIPIRISARAPVDRSMLEPGEAVPMDLIVTLADGRQVVAGGTTEGVTVQLSVPRRPVGMVTAAAPTAGR